MSPRRLSGWEPGEVTLFERDADGVVVRSVTIREPEFDELDVSALLEARRRAGERRGPHGYTIAEATDPANQFAFYTEKRTDWAMKTMLKDQARARKQYPDAADLNSIVWDVKRRG